MHPLFKQAFLLVGTIALLILIVQLPHTWAWANNNEGAAAWVQALGVFAAIAGTGYLATQSERRQAASINLQSKVIIFSAEASGPASIKYRTARLFMGRWNPPPPGPSPRIRLPAS
jgi:hypothetical protein